MGSSARRQVSIEESGSWRDSERLSFFASAAAEETAAGWYIAGEPGYTPEFWARPGDVFDEVTTALQDRRLPARLLVLESGPTHVVVTGDEGRQVEAGDVLSGERRVAT